MLTFVHLSDIHFRYVDHGTQIDTDQLVRRALLRDLEEVPKACDCSHYDGLLISGDIAFSGQKEEYSAAAQFINDVAQCTKIDADHTYVVPGNHDVDRRYVRPNLPLWDTHQKLRNLQNPVEWKHVVATLVKEDPTKQIVAPLTAYNNFAQKFGCATTTESLTWNQLFPKKLEDGSFVRLHGLNSALISDEADQPGKLLVSQLQTSHFQNQPHEINVVLCHHPPDWLMDKIDIRDSLNSFASVALFGHDHSTSVDLSPRLVKLFAGAVQPPERDAGNWVPTYHILQLSIEGCGEGRKLLIRVHTREYRNHRFWPRLVSESKKVEESRIDFPGPEKPKPTIEQPEPDQVVEPEDKRATLEEDATMEAAQRKLLVHFFRIGTPLRYAVAVEVGLIRDGDDELDPRAMWEKVFHRAIKENKLEAFWFSISKRAPELRALQNPFSK